MKFCVLMSTYNGEEFLIEQLDSIVNQKFEGELEFFIRDDCSKDETDVEHNSTPGYPKRYEDARYA